MRGISLFAGVGLVASLVLGASGLVMNPVNSGPHRRHAAVAVANVVVRDTPAVTAVPAPLLPRKTMAERRSMRQKRCFQRIADSATLTPTSSASADTNNAPANVAPAPTQESTTTTEVQQQAQPQPTPDAQPNTGSSSADTFSGQLTYYDVGLGACGQTNSNSDFIAAASMLLYDGFEGYTGANPNNNPICNKQAAVTYQGKTITVTIVDRCVGCAKYDLDLSPTAFSALADMGLGRLNGMTWRFL